MKHLVIYNDPRIKFKKVYELSHNLMYEERTGGFGGGTPRKLPTPTIYVPLYHSPPVNSIDPFSLFRPSIAPFDPYERKLQESLTPNIAISQAVYKHS